MEQDEEAAPKIMSSEEIEAAVREGEAGDGYDYVRRTLTDEVIAGVEGSDQQRGRAFLERVYGAEQGDRDSYEAAGALYGVLAYGAEQVEPSDVSDSSAAALGRVLRESS